MGVNARPTIKRRKGQEKDVSTMEDKKGQSPKPQQKPANQPKPAGQPKGMPQQKPGQNPTGKSGDRPCY
jgi:hypothetical protein